MHIKNTGSIERLIRVILSVIIFIIWFFWFGGMIEIVLLVISAILLITGVSGFCPLYTLFHIQRYRANEKISKLSWILFILLFFIVSIGWSYASIFFSKKFFLEDYNVMNNFYKQTLFNTGKDKRPESIANYDALVREYTIFLDKYSNYRPYSLRKDTNLKTDLEKISGI